MRWQSPAGEGGSTASVRRARRTRRVVTGAALPPALLRLLIVVLAAASVALVPHVAPLLLAAVVVGVGMAVMVPARAGAFVVLAALAWAWIASYGVHTEAPLPRTALLAALLYLTHAATALAAAVPLDAALDPAVLTRWAARCLPGVAAAAVAAIALAVPTSLTGSVALDVLGLAGAVVIVAVVVRVALSGRPDR